MAYKFVLIKITYFINIIQLINIKKITHEIDFNCIISHFFIYIKYKIYY